MDSVNSKTRQRILRVALKIFAECGYEGASVQAIVDAARVTKPTLYYYFKNKAALFQSLIDLAHDERYRLMGEAAARGRSLEERLIEVLAALFEFINENRALMRLAFGTAFAAKGEIPQEIRYLPKCERNFEFIHELIRQGSSERALRDNFSSRELTMGLYGMMTIKVMEHLVHGRPRLSRQDAEGIVHLYLGGAGHRAS